MLPPRVTATSTHMEGSPTELPTTRVDDVALKLLKEEEQYHKPEGADRVDQQNEEGANDTADESAENRNQSGEGNQGADNHAYGNRKMLMLTKNRVARMTASTH